MKKSIKLIVALGVGIGLLGGMEKAYAYTEESADPMENNTQHILKTDKGEVEVEGWLGTFNPTHEIDPQKPEPEKGDVRWVDVTLPTKILFGTLDSDKGKVYGPKYVIKNNSVKKVKVSVKELSFGDNGISSKLNLNLETLAPIEKISLLTDNSRLTEETQLADLNAKSEIAFTLKGKFDGKLPSISEAPLTPKYKLDFAFKVVD